MNCDLDNEKTTALILIVIVIGIFIFFFVENNLPRNEKKDIVTMEIIEPGNFEEKKRPSNIAKYIPNENKLNKRLDIIENKINVISNNFSDLLNKFDLLDD